MFRYFNPNPLGKKVGDCVVRGISMLLDQTWSETYIDICMLGHEMGDMPSSNSVWASYLHSKGYGRTTLPDTCPMCYTVTDFCEDHPSGRYLLATGSHVVCVSDGDYYDAWDSGNEVPVYYWEVSR